jgi:hypothetical protein
VNREFVTSFYCADNVHSSSFGVCTTHCCLLISCGRCGRGTCRRRRVCARNHRRKKQHKNQAVSNLDIPKQDVDWALSILEPEWAGETVKLEPEDAAALQAATKAYQTYIGREKRRMDGEIHRLIKLRRKALDSLPEDLRERALKMKPDTEPKVRLPTWNPPDKLYR